MNGFAQVPGPTNTLSIHECRAEKCSQHLPVMEVMNWHVLPREHLPEHFKEWSVELIPEW